MQPVPAAPTAAEDGGLSTHVLHMTRLHAKRPLLVELRVINGPFEGGCRLQSGGGAWLACNTSWPNAASQGRPPDGSGGESERSTPNGRAKTLWWWWWWWWWSGAHTTPNYLRQASQNLGKYHFKHSVLVPRIKRDRNLIPRLTIRGGDCTGLPPKSRRRLDNSSAGSLDPPLRA